MTKLDSNILDRGSRIVEERKNLGITQEKVAEKCEVSRKQWIRYEKNEQKLDGEVLKRFIAIGADGAYILGGVRGTEVEKQKSIAMLAANNADLNALTIKMMEDSAKVMNQRQELYDGLLTIFNTFDDEMMERARQNIVDLYHANLYRKNLK